MSSTNGHDFQKTTDKITVFLLTTVHLKEDRWKSMKQIWLLHGKPTHLKKRSYPIKKISKISRNSSVKSDGAASHVEWDKDGEPTTFIGPGVDCKGVMVGDGKMRVDGNMEGEIHSSGTLIVGEQGTVSAEIQAESIIADGLITGSVKAKKNMHLGSSAVVTGSVSTPYLSMEEGAVLDTQWSLWINGGRIPGNVWMAQYQHGCIAHPPWWPTESRKRLISS